MTGYRMVSPELCPPGADSIKEAERHPQRRSINQLLADYLDIDLAKLEEEKIKMLDQFRELVKKSEKSEKVGAPEG